MIFGKQPKLGIDTRPLTLRRLASGVAIALLAAHASADALLTACNASDFQTVLRAVPPGSITPSTGATTSAAACT